MKQSVNTGSGWSLLPVKTEVTMNELETIKVLLVEDDEDDLHPDPGSLQRGERASHSTGWFKSYQLGLDAMFAINTTFACWTTD